MRVSVEWRGSIEVLRCSGTHACRDEDHATDTELTKRLADGLLGGHGRFLLDVRELHVVYFSGIADIVQPLFSATSGPNIANAARVVVLWKPVAGLKKGWRWASFVSVLPAGVPLRFATEESEALAFLSSAPESGIAAE